MKDNCKQGNASFGNRNFLFLWERLGGISRVCDISNILTNKLQKFWKMLQVRLISHRVYLTFSEVDIQGDLATIQHLTAIVIIFKLVTTFISLYSILITFIFNKSPFHSQRLNFHLCTSWKIMKECLFLRSSVLTLLNSWSTVFHYHILILPILGSTQKFFMTSSLGSSLQFTNFPPDLILHIP